MLQTLKQSSAQKRENGSGAMHGRKRAANFFPPRSSAKYFERNASKSRDWMNDVREKKSPTCRCMTARLGKAEVTMWGRGISSAVRTWVTWVKERGYDRSRALARSWGEREEWGLRAPKSAKLSKRNDGPLKRVGIG